MEGVRRQLLGIGAILFGIAVSSGSVAGIVFGLVGLVLVLSGWERSDPPSGRREGTDPAPDHDTAEDREGHDPVR